VADHQAGRTPNPCVECNRHIKFDKLFRRADALGFELVATGHHARIVHDDASGALRIARGADQAKDQSYVLHMLGQPELRRLLFPLGHMTKDEARALAGQLGLRTADKPDSQDVCFIHSVGGREEFLGDRIPLRPARLVEADGTQVGSVTSVELVTLGQRKGLDLGGHHDRRYVVDIDHASSTVTVGPWDDLLVTGQRIEGLEWVGEPVEGPFVVQCSAHGRTASATLDLDEHGPLIRWAEPEKKVAPGQSVVLYVGDAVVAGGTAGQPIPS
jgi:tRNA-specific 2-thiouridylase